MQDLAESAFFWIMTSFRERHRVGKCRVGTVDDAAQAAFDTGSGRFRMGQDIELLVHDRVEYHVGDLRGIERVGDDLFDHGFSQLYDLGVFEVRRRFPSFRTVALRFEDAGLHEADTIALPKTESSLDRRD